jgi:pyridoxamine 5'-phosphate oxidase
MPDAGVTAADPFVTFTEWMAEAWRAEPEDANAMTLATASPGGAPAARIVLLKGVDGAEAANRGFVFYTNKQSRKGDELADNTQTALLFHWKPLGRQVRIEGRVEHVTDAEADAYFASRPRISRLGAWASDQSRPLATRADLQARLASYEARYPGEDIPRPPHWSGYRVVPRRIEFWQNMPFRLHDRTVYTRNDGGWTSGKLFP